MDNWLIRLKMYSKSHSDLGRSGFLLFFWYTFSMKEKNITLLKSWQQVVTELLVCTLVFLVPLAFEPDSIFAFSPIKLILSVGIVLLMAIFYLWGSLNRRELSIRITPLHIVILVFLSVITLSSILGIDTLNSFFGRWREGISLVLIYALTIFAFIVGSLVKKDNKFLPKVILISFIGSFCVAAISYAGGYLSSIFVGGGSTIGNSSYSGAYLLFNVCFGVGLFFYYSKIWQKVLIMISSVFIILSPVFFNIDIFLGKVKWGDIIHRPMLLLGQANAATIGLAMSLIVALFFFLINSEKKVIRIIGASSLIILMLGISFVGFELVNPKSSLHNTYTEVKGENRFVAWDIAKESFAVHPLLGSGFNNFSYNYQKYFTSDILKEKDPEFYFNQPHNVVWEYASNNGLLGLVSFLSLLVFTLVALFGKNEREDKKEKIIKTVLIGIIFGYFVQNLFGFDTPTTYLMLFLVIGLAIGLHGKEWIYKIKSERTDGFKFLSGVLIIVSIILLFPFVIFPIKEIGNIKKILSTNEIKYRIELRNESSGISLFGGVKDDVYIADKYYAIYIENMKQIESFRDKDLYLKDIDSIVSQLENDVIKQPNEAEAYFVMSHFLNMEIYLKGQLDMDIWDKSYNYVKKAIAISPENPDNYILLAQTYILKQDFKNAFSAMRDALDIAPNYANSYEYADKLLKAKPNKNFEKYLNNMKNTRVTP